MPNVDIMREVLRTLRARIQAGIATFLVKVKSHRGEPINEQQIIWQMRAGENPMKQVFRRHGLREWSPNGREGKVAGDEFGRMEYATGLGTG